MAPARKSNFKGAGRTIGGRTVMPKGARAQEEIAAALYQPYNESGEETDDSSCSKESEVPPEEMQHLVETYAGYWTSDSEAGDEKRKNLQNEREHEKQLQKNLKSARKKECIMDQVDKNAKRGRGRLGDIIVTYSRIDEQINEGKLFVDIVDASETNADNNRDPASKVDFVPCLNGSYTMQKDGSFSEVDKPEKRYHCKCRVCRHRRKNKERKRAGTLRSGKVVKK